MVRPRGRRRETPSRREALARRHVKGQREMTMARHVQVTLELPDEVLPQARDEEIIARLREHLVGQF